MDIAEVKEFLEKDDAGKSLLAEYVEKHPDIAGLKSKNAELIEINKRFKAEKNEALSTVDELREDLESAKSVDVKTEVERATKQLKKDLEAATGERDAITGKMKSMTLDSAMNEAVKKAGIATQHIDAVMALIRTKNELDIDDTDNTVKVGGKPLTDFVTEWAESDHGKHYVSAPDNNGGGARPLSSTGGGKLDVFNTPATALLNATRGK